MNDILTNSNGIEAPSDKVELEKTKVPEKPPVDAVVNVTVSDNKLEAYLLIEPPKDGGSAPTIDKIKSVLASRNITFGIDYKLIEELAVNPVYSTKITIAKGVAPINGKVGTAEFHFKTLSDSRPLEKEDGNVDFHDLCIVESVNKNQVLCSITLPTQGEAGMSVTGQVLKQAKGKPVPYLVGKNTELSEDGKSIYAKISGQVEFNGRTININETYYTRGNVGIETGNLKIAGNIVISGGIMPGFLVEAGGSVEVKGTVEAATIRAGGNIILHSGLTGSELNCKGDLCSRFIENSNVFVKGDVKSEYILNSHIKCGKNLQIVGPIAKFVGGSCLVGQDMVARVIGSMSGVKTELELGTDSTTIERYQEITSQLPELEKQVKNLNSIISLLQQLEAAGRLSSEKKEVLDKALYSFETTSDELEQGKWELEEIKREIELRGYGRVICTGKIYPGTSVKIGYGALTINDTLTGTSLYNSGGVIFKCLTK